GDARRTLNPELPAGAQFGFSVAAAGADVLIGAPFLETETEKGGATYLFDGTAGTLRHSFSSPAPKEGDQFGYAVAATGSGLLVGAPLADVGQKDAGAAYLFDGTSFDLVRRFGKAVPRTGD